MKISLLLKRKNNNKGQSILEFALILPFVFFFIFLHIQTCITYVIAQYANYVSFMSARVVLTNGHLTGRHIGEARRYVPDALAAILRMDDPRLIRYDSINRAFVNGNTIIKNGPQWKDEVGNDDDDRNLGVEISYSIPVFLPFIRELGESLRFRTRTVLGREPYHGSNPIQVDPWLVADPNYGDSSGDDSACNSVYNDNGC